MSEQTLGMENAIWDDGEWISWSSINSHLERLELEAKYPNAGLNLDLAPLLDELLQLAWRFNCHTDKHLKIYGDIGEIFGAVMYGIKLHRDKAMGSDGRLGNDFIEVKTITPFKNNRSVTVNLKRHFSKLLVVKIDSNFEISGMLVDRARFPKAKGDRLRLHWDDLKELE